MRSPGSGRTVTGFVKVIQVGLAALLYLLPKMDQAGRHTHEAIA